MGAHYCIECEMRGFRVKAVHSYVSPFSREETHLCERHYRDAKYVMEAFEGFDQFGGITYDPDQDKERLGEQMCRVLDACLDGKWHTLKDLSEKTGDPEASISARLRDIRKKHGKAAMESRRLKEGKGTWVYRVHVRVAA